ncbi:MAG: histidine phosphatase family protein [Deltaproteobacteria bacterium]|nr:histidine phosphatase family protein [Deltaproteobacteria bacterium]
MLYIVRHGETSWSLTGQHTGKTDLNLTEHGRLQAKLLKPHLAEEEFKEVWCSPLNRAIETCDLAGFCDRAQYLPELEEWDYGDYEGRKRVDIIKECPDWLIFNDGVPGGESPQEVYERAQYIVDRAKRVDGDVLVFSSGHISRVIAACWLEQPVTFAKQLKLSTASLSILGEDHKNPAIAVWNWTPKAP